MKGNPLQFLLNNRNNKHQWSQEVLIQISESQVGRAIRTDKWKYSVKAPNKDGILYSKSDVYQEEYLYDLENDYFEKFNLVNKPEYHETRKYLVQILKRKMIEAGVTTPKILPSEKRNY
jgi:uncharacterized sulfatase